ncbi:MAG: formyltetrahydrofolate deformylase [Methylacidiphilales bacterium]|nr:formyltetrahydrofolate deformylase [Candidatus Methylacidiphilales bacterium]MDW8349475.1 formyltetrahydrofolate deformylase [Verrucomicrobiae bacterium]
MPNTQPPQILTITLIGNDKAGVIARTTHLLFECGANIEGLEEQVTRGHFSMTLQASFSSTSVPLEIVEARLRALAAELEMALTIRRVHTGPQRMGILVTKEPHCLRAILQATLSPTSGSPTLNTQPVVVIGNHPTLEPLAIEAGLPFYHVDFTDRKEAEKKTLNHLLDHDVDFIVLARFMKILSPDFVWRWKNKIINIHPSLLPSFPGANAYRQAYEKGVKIAGATAHFVTPQLDEGPIIAQEAFTIEPEDSIKDIVAKGQAAESKCLLRAIQIYLDQRYDIHWGKVFGV